MAPVAGKAMRKRKRVTFAVMPEDGVTAADGTMPDDSHEAESMKVAIGEVTADDPRPDDDRTAHSTSGETTARGTEVTEGTTKTRRRTKTRSSARGWRKTAKAGGGEKNGGGTRRKAAKLPEVGTAAGQHGGDEVEAVRRPTGGPTLQLTDAEIIDAQAKTRLVQRLLDVGEHQEQEVTRQFGLVTIKTSTGRRVALPPAL
ncbi:hypothetical protein PR001_g12940 [Phytophthora rubi]|uniref:Uncharacterized protein n=1 Tax=Phytophthora rubi TaxID=129364 RepID=A0A6A3LUJ2_9STRA|nr:hypothetical protein PR001_g12940 [Phytophthora rubi]